MPSLTLPEAAVLVTNPVVSGIIETIVTTGDVFTVLPFKYIEGNSLAYTRELSLGDSQIIGVGSTAGANTITAKAPTKVTQASSRLIPIVGDAEVDHFEMVTMSGDNDQEAVQVAGKAKSIGRQYQSLFITGDVVANPLAFDGLQKLVPVSQQVGAAGQVYSFGILDELMDKVKSKDGQVDMFMMNSINVRRHLELLRRLGGANITEVVNLPGGRTTIAYRGVPIFKNDWVPVATGAEPGLGQSDIYAAAFDDGSGKVGLSGLGPVRNNGIFVTRVGEKENANDVITRVRLYCGLALFNELAVGRALGVDSLPAVP